MKKKGIFALLGLLIGLVLLINSVSALGISPAIYEIEYQPNEKHTLNLEVYPPDPSRKIIMNVEGEAIPYVTLSKKEFYGRGTVKALITMPPQMNTPGINRWYISAEEAPKEDQFISTSIRVRTVIKIHVPYPGKYIESSLSIPNGNIGENIPVELSVKNRGTENLTIKPIIRFYDNQGNLIQTMEFSQVNVKTTELRYFRKYLNTTGFKPDNYFADAEVNYGGEISHVNTTFKTGNLFVKIIDFTKNLTAKEINRFDIKVKSEWNDNLEGVYANIVILNESFQTNFATPQMDLPAWAEKMLTGYIDARGLARGQYDADVILHYEGESNFASGKISVMERDIWMEPMMGMPTKYFASGIIIVIILFAISYYLIIKKKSRNSKSRRR